MLPLSEKEAQAREAAERADAARQLDRTVPGGVYINEAGFYVNANGEYVDEHGKVVEVPRSAEAAPKAPAVPRAADKT